MPYSPQRRTRLQALYIPAPQFLSNKAESADPGQPGMEKCSCQHTHHSCNSASSGHEEIISVLAADFIKPSWEARTAWFITSALGTRRNH
eukprot:2881292-Amphidinium_carterae.1